MPVAPEEAVFRIQVAVTGEKHALDSSDLRFRAGLRKFAQAKLACIWAMLTHVHAFVHVGNCNPGKISKKSTSASPDKRSGHLWPQEHPTISSMVILSWKSTAYLACEQGVVLLNDTS